MKSYRSTNRKGFTLVEILIVVIILGILAAIVIPQFTNASEDARKSSMTSQLQTLRSQVELYKLQHRDAYPLDASGAWDWTKLTTKTDDTGAASAAATAVGPYLQQIPVNSLNKLSNVVIVAADPAVGAAGAGGFVFSSATGKIFGVDKDSKVTAD
jgi:general secretion pathway protein G